MMKCSAVPEIAALAKEKLAMDDYWNDTSDNIEVMSEQNIDSTTENRSILNDDESKGEKLKLHLLSIVKESDNQISPNLTYMFMFPKTGDFEKDSFTEKSDVPYQNKNTIKNDLKTCSATSEDQLESFLAVLQR